MDYVTLSTIHDDNLYVLFLNMVDDFTLDKLRKVPLSRDQMTDARKFIDLYEKKINPLHEGRTFRSKLADLKQKSGESIEDFALPIQPPELTPNQRKLYKKRRAFLHF